MVKLIMAISAPAVPGGAEAIHQARRTDVRVIGLSLPNINLDRAQIILGPPLKCTKDNIDRYDF